MERAPIKKFSLSFIIPTICGIGKIPFAPGTFGSLVAVLEFSFYISKVSLTLMSAYIIFAGIAGLYFTYSYMNITKKHDPKEVIIDEYIGQYIALILSYAIAAFFAKELVLRESGQYFVNFYVIAVSFLLFRFFDIVKPWIIGYFDKEYNNARGVMLDDIFAGIFAGLLNGGAILIYKMLF